MGYTSEIRVILKRQDFEELKKKMSKYYKEKNYDYDLFDTNDYLLMVEENENWVKFGWNGLKWYKGYEDVDLIMEFIESREQYHYMRLGEEYGDLEERDMLEYEEDCPEPSYVSQYIED